MASRAPASGVVGYARNPWSLSTRCTEGRSGRTETVEQKSAAFVPKLHVDNAERSL